MPPSPPLLLCPTIEIPKKLTVSMFSVTVIIFNDILESVIEEKEEVRDIAVACRCLLLLGALRLPCPSTSHNKHIIQLRRPIQVLRYTNTNIPNKRLVALPVVVVIRLEASSSDSRKLVVSSSELITDEVS